MYSDEREKGQMAEFKMVINCTQLSVTCHCGASDN